MSEETRKCPKCEGTGKIRFAIGEEIKRIRMLATMTQVDLAERAGVDQSSLSSIESGRYQPTVATLMRIAKALGVKVSQIMEE